MIEYAKYSEIKAGHREDVERLTRDGWVLIEIVPSTNVYLANIQKMRWPEGRDQTYRGGDVYNEQEAHVVQQPIFVFGRARDAVIDDLREQVANLVRQAREAHEVASTAEGQARKAEMAADQQRKAQTQAEQRATALAEANGSLRERLAKMERDVAKVREHVGADRMKEILG